MNRQIHFLFNYYNMIFDLKKVLAKLVIRNNNMRSSSLKSVSTRQHSKENQTPPQEL